MATTPAGARGPPGEIVRGFGSGFPIKLERKMPLIPKRLMFPLIQTLVSLVLFTGELVKVLLAMPDWVGLLSHGWQAVVNLYELATAIIHLSNNDDGTSTPSE